MSEKAEFDKNSADSAEASKKEVAQVPNEDKAKVQPWREWLPKEEQTPCPEKPWIGWKPDPKNESAKPWIDWVKTAGIVGAGPTGNAGG